MAGTRITNFQNVSTPPQPPPRATGPCGSLGLGAVGPNAGAGGPNSAAMGPNSAAMGPNSAATGPNSAAMGSNSAAMGPTAGAVALRAKSSQASGDRLSQSKSMVLQDTDLPQKPINRHRRNQSQHNMVAGHEVALTGEHLNVAKLCDSGKKQRKNWNVMWSVLTSDQLLLYKENNQKAGSKTDVVELSGAVIEWNTEKSSRKNVIQIQTVSGSELLLQCDSVSTATRWFSGLRNAVGSSTEAVGGFSLRRSNSSDFLPRHSSLPGRGSNSPNAKQRNPAHRRSINMFKLKHSASDSADKNGVKNRLKKFISRRPSMKTLQEKGLIKDRVFGCRLSALCEREGGSVPRFVQMCVDTVDKRGLAVDGIYRVSGNLATIQKLRFIIDQEEALDLDHSQWEDIHVVTGALKLFFRELPEPLFPFCFFQPFVDAIKIKESKHKVQAVKKLIQDLPAPNHDTMKLLFSHMHRVLASCRQNQMSTQSLGIVLGPTLLWPQSEGGNMALNMLYQNSIVEFILIHSTQLFSS